VLGPGGAALGWRLRTALAGARLHGPRAHPGDWDESYDRVSTHIGALFDAGRPIVGICASGILIRSVAPFLVAKQDEPAVVAVDDDDGHIELVRRNFQRAGIGNDIVPIHNGSEALDYAFRRGAHLTRPADAELLFLLDINMPGGTGIEALRKLKLSAKTSTIPVIVLSGNTDADVPQQVKSLGAEEFLAKPIDPEILLDSIRRALGQPAP